MLNFYYPGKLAAPCQVYKTGANSDYTEFKKVKYKDKEYQTQTTLSQAVRSL